MTKKGTEKETDEEVCSFCDVPLEGELDVGTRCSSCKAPLCFDCEQAVGKCPACMEEEDVGEGTLF